MERLYVILPMVALNFDLTTAQVNEIAQDKLLLMAFEKLATALSTGVIEIATTNDEDVVDEFSVHVGMLA